MSPRRLPTPQPMNAKATQVSTQTPNEPNNANDPNNATDPNALARNILREVVVPILEKEVNEGRNFAPLRQVYHSLILAFWYKDMLRSSLLSKAYVDQAKIGGVDIADKAAGEKIWARYVAAFKKGAYDLIKEEYDPAAGQLVPRRYFSGGIVLGRTEAMGKEHDGIKLPPDIRDRSMVVGASLGPFDPAQALAADHSEWDAAGLGEIRRDGQLNSEKGDALELFVADVDKLPSVNRSRFDQILQYFTLEVKELRNRTPENPNKQEAFDEENQALDLVMARLTQAARDGRIVSRPMVVKGKNNFATGAYFNGYLVVADELLNQDTPLLVEYLFRCASRLGTSGMIMAQQDILKSLGNGDRLLKLIKKRILERVVVWEGVDQRAVITKTLESFVEPVKAVFTDDSDPIVNSQFSSGVEPGWPSEVEQVFRSETGQACFYGSWPAVVRMGVAYDSTKEHYRQRKHVKVAINSQGLVGIWGAPERANEVIRAVFATTPGVNVILADIGPLTALVDLCRLNIPIADEALAGYIRSVIGGSPEDKLSYETAKAVLDVLLPRLAEIEQGVERAQDLGDYDLENSLAGQKDELVFITERAFGLISPLMRREFLRLYCNEVSFDQESVNRILPMLVEDGQEELKIREAELLWNIYLDPHNSGLANERIVEALRIRIGNEEEDIKKALTQISFILIGNDTVKSSKAVQILLGMNLSRASYDDLLPVLEVAGPYSNLVAAYILGHIKLFGFSADTVRSDVYGNEDRKLLALPLGRNRDIYYQALKTHDSVRQGGLSNGTTDGWIFQYSIALDMNSKTPGQNGYSWFSALREEIHRSLAGHHFHFVKAILRFWQSLDFNPIVQVQREHLFSVYYAEQVVADPSKNGYSQVLNMLLNRLQEQGEISGGPDSIEQLLLLNEERVLEVFNELDLKQYVAFSGRVENMIRLCFALNEKFSSSIPRAIEAVRLPGSIFGRMHFPDSWIPERPEYKALIKALEGADEPGILEAIVNLRLTIREYLLNNTVDSGADPIDYFVELSNRRQIMLLDHNLHFLGRHYLNSVLNRHLLNGAAVPEVRANIAILRVAAQFIQAQGLGGVDLEQYIRQLQSGDLTNSQLYDIARALESEVMKAVGQLDQSIRFVVQHMLGEQEYTLAPRWHELVTDKVSGREVVTDENRQAIARALVDDLVRESGLDVLKAALSRFTAAAASGLAQSGGPALIDQPAAEVTADPKVLRFGQGAGDSVEPGSLQDSGNKGLRLWQMGRHGVPVPPGFVAPFNGPQTGIRTVLAAETALLRAARQDPAIPELYFVRSGSAFMMAGLLMTIPNVGMNDAVAEELARSTGDAWFAYDTYGTFLRDFGINVLGINEPAFAAVADVFTKDRLSAEAMWQVVDGYKEVIARSGKTVPEDVLDQLVMAVEAVKASWNSPRARKYRQRHNISDDWGTPVIVQNAAFGNHSRSDSDKGLSGSGSAALRIGPDGQPFLRGEFRLNGQGELIMSAGDLNVIAISSGAAIPAGGSSLEAISPQLYKQLLEQVLRVRTLAGYPPLSEFVLDRGKLWITQSNDDLESDFGREFANTEEVPLARGEGLGGGAVRGWVANSIPKARELVEKYNRLRQDDPQAVEGVDGVVLVTGRVSPEMIGQIPNGVHLLAQKLSVHAMTLSRGLGVTVVAGIPEGQLVFDDTAWHWVLGRRPLIDEDVISLDGHSNPGAYPLSGNVYQGSLPLVPEADVPDSSPVVGVPEDHSETSTPGLDAIWRDGVINSEERKALEAFVAGAGQLSSADWVKERYYDVVQYLTAKNNLLRTIKAEGDYQREELAKIKEAMQSDLRSLAAAARRDRIVSRPMVVEGKRNFATGAYIDEWLVVADEMQGLSTPLLAEYLVRCVLKGGGEVYVSSGTAEKAFRETAGQLRETVRNMVLARAMVHDNLDQRAAITQALEGLPAERPQAVFTDESDPLLGRNPDTNPLGWAREVAAVFKAESGQTCFYGSWPAVVRIGMAYESAKDEYRQRSHVKVAVNRQGLPGIWGVPERANAVIRQVLASAPDAGVILADIGPLTALVELGRLDCPMADEALAAYIRSVMVGAPEVQLSYEMTSGVLDVLFQRLEGLERQLVGSNIHDHIVRMELADRQREWRQVVARVLALLPSAMVREYLRSYFLERRPERKVIRQGLEIALNDSEGERIREATGMLWDIYLDPRNTADEDAWVGAALIEKSHAWEGLALDKIYSVLSVGELKASHKAISVLLGLELLQKHQQGLLALIDVAGPYQPIIAAYILAQVNLLGVKGKASRGDIEDLDDKRVDAVLSGLAPNIYHYMMTVYAALSQGGVPESTVDYRIFNYARVIDNNANYPGANGRTWFTKLRENIHGKGNKMDDLFFVQGVLMFWQSLNADTFNKIEIEKQRYVFGKVGTDIINDPYGKQYSQTLKKMLAEFRKTGELGRDRPFLEQLADLGEERVIAVLKAANPRATEYILVQAEYMLRLYFALSEKFILTLPRAIATVKNAAAVDEIPGWNGDYLAFARTEYEALLKVIDGTDDARQLEALVALRLRIKERLLRPFVAEAPGPADHVPDDGMPDARVSDQIERIRLAELDRNLHLLGRNYLNNVLNRALPDSPGLEDIRSYASILLGAARFLVSQGLGGVELEQLITEMQHGDLVLSQLADLVRALQSEVFKATDGLSRDMRALGPYIVKGYQFSSLDPKWASLIRTEQGEVVFMGTSRRAEVLREDSRQDIESALVDELIRETGLDLIKPALTRMERILEARISASGDEVFQARPEVTAVDPDRLDPQFLRFGQSDTAPDAGPRLLSLWSRKGLNLLQMSAAGIQVPPGVVVSSNLMTRPEIIHSAPFRERVSLEIERLRKLSRYPDLKLLLYARSGSAFMLPGLLSTIPNVGMNDNEAVDLARNTGDVWFAYDTYASFVRGFAINVLGLDEQLFQDVFDVYSKDKVSGERMKEVVELYKEVVRAAGKTIPEAMIDQVLLAVEAVYASWDSPGARDYRAKHRISSRWGTVVILQKGVFGNISKTADQRISGAGSATLTSTADGRFILTGEFRYRGQGDQIMSQADQNTVSLNHEESPLKNGQTFEELNPGLYQKVLGEVLRIKALFSHDPLVEFIIERGEVYFTQTNDDDPQEDFPQFKDDELVPPIVRGKGLSGGAVRGWVVNSVPNSVAQTIAKVEKFQRLYLEMKERDPQSVDGIDGVILLVERVNPQMIGRIPKGVSILARKLSVHAVTQAQKDGIAIVAEVPDEQMVFDEATGMWSLAGQVMVDGQTISADGHRNPLIHHKSGNIYLGSRPLKEKPAAAKSLPKDSAAKDPGGIDLTRQRVDLEVKGSAPGALNDLDLAMLQSIQDAAGLVPVILGVQPLNTSLPAFFGHSEQPMVN
ncbi:MAG: hypothetical protein HQL20_00005 [Candidatus Omnitrophica bacterium]|nr:hypothetical protein [Candidatus Omnitrophota bacterium]